MSDYLVKNKEFLHENGPIKVKVGINKYGVELCTTRNGQQWTGIQMSPELAKLTIAALEDYLNWI